MVLVTSNKQQRLLCIQYIERVVPADLAGVWGEIEAQLKELPVGFRVLADLSQVELMDLDCRAEIGRAMDLIAQRGVSLIVRVIPDASKDIGLNILTIFHYPDQPRIITCENLPEAFQKLAVF